MVNRRSFVGTMAAAVLLPRAALAGAYRGSKVVRFRTPEKPGTILVKTHKRRLFFILGDGRAIRYGVAVGKEGFDWAGIAKVGRKVEWPTWTPPASMIERRPELAKYANGMPGGEDNPLGARAIYLFDGGRDTLFRIHGTNEPEVDRLRRFLRLHSHAERGSDRAL